MPNTGLNCVQALLENSFEKYGRYVSNHPLPFVIVPILTSILLSFGVFNVTLEKDIEYLYTPTNGPAKDERRIIQSLFPENHSHYFSSPRKINWDGFFQMIITSKGPGNNIYNPTILTKVLTLNEAIQGFTDSNGNTYREICGAWLGVCHENAFLRVLNGSSDVIQERLITYPVSGREFLGQQLGGVSVNGSGVIQNAEAIYLTYYLRYQLLEEIKAADVWMKSAQDFMASYTDDVHMHIDYQSALSLSEEIDKSVVIIFPLFTITYTVLMTFCVVSCITIDVVRTKPWFAVAGEVSAGMAVASSLGLLSGAGMRITSTVGVMPFLIIGIGIDNMFVILSSWRHTSYVLSVEERVAQTCKTAAISITLTSMTDALAFGIGAITTFRSVTIFCAYTGIAVLFCYIYAITFLVGVLTYTGRREAANIHAATCKPVLPTDQVTGERSKSYILCCTGGYKPITSDTDGISNNEKKQSNVQTNIDLPLYLPWLTVFVKESFAPVITHKAVKIIVLLAYCAYMVFGIIGCTQLEEGLKVQNLAPDGSYIQGFFDIRDKYFSSVYGPYVMFAFTDTLDYSDESVRNNIFSQLDAFQRNNIYYSDEIYLNSWLQSFLYFMQVSSQAVPNDMVQFIAILRNQFLQNPNFERYSRDIAFNDDFTEILSSRMFIQSRGTQSTLEERDLMQNTRSIAEDSQFAITTYHFGFIFFDQYVVIRRNTVTNIVIGVASMLLVSIILLPSLVAIFIVFLSVLSICTGVVGYMVFWNVPLDTISMINLIICIGFSVDFCAHISYHFSISELRNGDDKVKEALSHVGTAIAQGAISTILGVVILSTSGSYIFRTFFKIMFLVMTFGFMHAMFILPVILSLTNCNSTGQSDIKISHEIIDDAETAEKEKEKPAVKVV